MENLAAASTVTLKTVEKLDINDIKDRYHLAVTLDCILQSLNEITIRADKHLAIHFDMSSVVAFRQNLMMRPFIERVVAKLFNIKVVHQKYCEDEHACTDCLKESVRKVVSINIDRNNIWNVIIPQDRVHIPSDGGRQLLLTLLEYET